MFLRFEPDCTIRFVYTISLPQCLQSPSHGSPLVQCSLAEPTVKHHTELGEILLDRSGDPRDCLRAEGSSGSFVERVESIAERPLQCAGDVDQVFPAIALFGDLDRFSPQLAIPCPEGSSQKIDLVTFVVEVVFASYAVPKGPIEGGEHVAEYGLATVADRKGASGV